MSRHKKHSAQLIELHNPCNLCNLRIKQKGEQAITHSPFTFVLEPSGQTGMSVLLKPAPDCRR